MNIEKHEQDLNKFTKYIWVRENNCFKKVEVLDEDLMTLTTIDNVKYNTNDVFNVNPIQFDNISNLANLTYLNIPSILDVLKNRYFENKNFTESGLFLISINPYRKNFTSLSNDFDLKETKDDEPNIYKTAQKVYNSLCESNRSQSILVTGESGAGKTVNTRKLIEFLGMLNNRELDDINNLLILSNPILESFGNAKTVKNDNSSRFGKFVQIYFQNNQIIGGKIEKYLLELSRVTHINSNERNYHIFYYLLNSGNKNLLDMLKLEGNDFGCLKNGCYTADTINDKESFKMLRSGLKMFNIDEIKIFRTIAAILHMSNIEIININNSLKIKDKKKVSFISSLLSIDEKSFVESIIEPKMCAGGYDVINISRDIKNCYKILETIIKTLYNNLFNTILEHINNKLANEINQRSLYNNIFIGILDIAGFEIFEENGYEQLLINYTNEKLQQYFNHKMFIEEQKIYKEEGVKWNYIDFGLDLEPTIQTIENKAGILSLIDQCSILNSKEEDLVNNIKKIKLVVDVKHKVDSFKLKHYAGEVEYKVDNWVEKNKHISSTEVDDLFNIKSDTGKLGIFRTISQEHKENLKQLMKVLNNTDPHYIRCILPNLDKQPYKFDSELIVNQLKCNGVLEGLRISRLGFPTKIFFNDFISNYSICLSNLPAYKNNINNLIRILKEMNIINDNNYLIGKNRIFFKQGILGELENIKIQYLIKNGNLLRKIVSVKVSEIKIIRSRMIENIRENVDMAIDFNNFKWWRLFLKIKPLLNGNSENKMVKLGKENKELSERNIKLNDDLIDITNKYNDLIEDINNDYVNLYNKATGIKNDLDITIKEDKSILDDLCDKIKRIDLSNKNDAIKNLEELVKKLKNENNELFNKNSLLLTEVNSCKNKMIVLENDNNNLEDKNVYLKKKINQMDLLIKNNMNKYEPVKETNIVNYEEKIQLLENINKELKNDKDKLYNENISLSKKSIEDMFKMDRELKNLTNKYTLEVNRLKEENNRLTEELNKEESSDGINMDSIYRNKDYIDKINELELKNYDLENRLKNLNIKDFKNELIRMKTTINSLYKDFINRFINLIKEKDEYYKNIILDLESEGINEENKELNGLVVNKLKLKLLKEENKKLTKLYNEREESLLKYKELLDNKVSYYKERMENIEKNYEVISEGMSKFIKNNKIDKELINININKMNNESINSSVLLESNEVYKVKINQLERENEDLKIGMELLKEYVNKKKK
ncbi:Y4A0 [Hepatospora eriocheir]|uniref:Y4A0 n=1 Tax=Hepatospora eriocheir TaxID=1081669 RepID=A0A1X0QE56_9MICR|nr:Y4A0 [Hepatospora eriocheir]